MWDFPYHVLSKDKTAFKANLLLSIFQPKKVMPLYVWIVAKIISECKVSISVYWRYCIQSPATSLNMSDLVFLWIILIQRKSHINQVNVGRFRYQYHIYSLFILSVMLVQSELKYYVHSSASSPASSTLVQSSVYSILESLKFTKIECTRCIKLCNFVTWV